MRRNLVLSMSVPTVVYLKKKEKYSAPNRTYVEKIKGL